jgi:hypothetical protein
MVGLAGSEDRETFFSTLLRARASRPVPGLLTLMLKARYAFGLGPCHSRL